MKIILLGMPLSGKTTFLRKLKNKGINTFHVDEFVLELYKPNGVGYKRVLDTLGSRFVNEKGIDQKELTKAAILDKTILEKLNMIVMPLIQEELSKPGLQVIEASGMPIPSVDKKIIIKASKDEIKRRFLINSPQTRGEIIDHLYEKWDNNIKADMIIDSSNGFDDKDIESFIKEFINEYETT